MDNRSAQEIGLEFAQLVTGTTVVDGSLDPASPLGRLLAFAAARGEDAVTPAHVAAARDGLPLPGESAV